MKPRKLLTLASLLLLFSFKVPPNELPGLAQVNQNKLPEPTNVKQSKQPSFRSSDPAPNPSNRNKLVTLPANSLASLVRNSRLVFIGHLINQDVVRDKRGLIITRNHFQIEKTLVGSFNNKKITLTTLGGTLGGQTLSVSHLPVFEKGRRYVIFTDQNRTTYNPITGNEDGVFLIEPSDSGVYNYHGISVAGVEKGVIRLGRKVLIEHPQQNLRGPSSQIKNPNIRGNIISVQGDLNQATMAAEPVISVERFAESIQSLAGQQ